MCPQPDPTRVLRLGLPKGRMEGGVLALLADAGIHVRPGARGYRPEVSLAETEAKLLKPQNVVEMLAAGSRDAGFAGADWVAELEVELIDLLDTELDPVQIVAAGSIRSRSWRPRQARFPTAGWSWRRNTSGSPVPGSPAAASAPTSCAPTARRRCFPRRMRT